MKDSVKKEIEKIKEYYHQYNSESFDEFILLLKSDRFLMEHICFCQNLSEEFIKEFEDRVNWVLIYNNENIPKSIIEKIKLEKNIWQEKVKNRNYRFELMEI